MDTLNSVMNGLVFCFIQILILSVNGTILIAVSLCLRKFMGKYTKKNYLYYLWIGVLIFLILPFHLMDGIRLPSAPPPDLAENSISADETNAEGILMASAAQNRAAAEAGGQEMLTQEERLPVLEERSDIDRTVSNDVDMEDNLQENAEQEEDIGRILPAGAIMELDQNREYVIFLFLETASLIWAFGLLFLLSRRAMLHRRFRKALKAGEVPEGHLGDFARKAFDIAAREAERMRLKRMPQILFHDNISSPLLTGIFSQKIYLSVDEISETELKNVLCHELIHAKRKDLIYSLFADLIHLIHWFNPMVAKMIGKIEEDREFSCDEAVISSMEREGRKLYCKTILMNIYRARNKQIAGDISFNKNKCLVERRVGEIMKQQKKRNGLAGFICVLFCMVIAAGGCAASKEASKKNAEETKDFIDRNAEQVSSKENRNPEPVSASETEYPESGFSRTYDNIRNLEIHSYFSKVAIKEGKECKLEARNLDSKYSISYKDGSLIIRDESEESHFINGYMDAQAWESLPEITLYIPGDYALQDVILDVSGVTIEGLTADTLRIDSGSFEVDAQDIKAQKTIIDSGSGSSCYRNSDFGRTNIDSGSGSFEIVNGKMKDLELDSGSGFTTIQASIDGDIGIDSGSGNVSMQVGGRFSDYNLTTNNGSGRIFINGKEYEDADLTSAAARCAMDIDSGSGNVTIDFTDKMDISEADSAQSAYKENQIVKNSEVTSKSSKKNYRRNLKLSVPQVDADYQKYLNIKDKRLISKKSIAADSIDAIRMDFQNAAVHVYATREKDITVIQSYPDGPNYRRVYRQGKQYSEKVDTWTLKEEEKMKITNKNKTLTISAKGVEKYSSANRVDNPPTLISIFIPVSYKKNLFISTGIEDIILKHPLKLDKIEAHAGVGDIMVLEAIMAGRLDINAGVGDITVKGDISSETLSMNAGVGDILVARNLYCNKITISAGVGDCTLRMDISTREITIELDVGDLMAGKIYGEVKKDISTLDWDDDYDEDDWGDWF